MTSSGSAAAVECGHGAGIFCGLNPSSCSLRENASSWASECWRLVTCRQFRAIAALCSLESIVADVRAVPEGRYQRRGGQCTCNLASSVMYPRKWLCELSHVL
ncbi:hypothetical protein Zmor_002860 [Zophobas morio]|uniref:Uncharacterized protein n=1 Tax=Zophobas morio TaxID=2755281 RepID=A0AA38M0R7_9CUCU|nr:hypothetical protein Zmor_002860 [Zophobas morio]